MSGVKHLKTTYIPETGKVKRERHPTQEADIRGIPTMVMSPTGKKRMVWA